jgi:competence protein ComEA
MQRARDWVVWFGVGRLVAVALSVLAIGAGGYWLLHPPPTPVDASLPRAGQVTGATSPSAPTAEGGTAIGGSVVTAPASEIVVHVAGAVVVPGVHQLPLGARVIDAVVLAGGAAPDADVNALNLAAPLRDGDRLYVPRAGEVPPVQAGITPPTGGDGAASSGPININSATAAQLDSLPGVGPATAQAIVDHRSQHGPFASVDSLTEVRGIGPAKLEALRTLVTV